MKIKLMRMLTLLLINGAVLNLSGCSSSLNSESSNGPTVADAYYAAMRNDTAYLKNNVDSSNINSGVSETDRLPNIPKIIIANESTVGTLNAQFPTLPNPQSKMYIFGHFAGDEQIPVFGHFVPFSLYTRTYYALPNEVLKPYNDGQFFE